MNSTYPSISLNKEISNLSVKMMNKNYLKVYLIKLKSNQLNEIVIEQLFLSMYNKYNEWVGPKNNIKDLLKHKEVSRMYIDNEWNYSLPINYEYPVMNENEKEYYKDLYKCIEYIHFDFIHFDNHFDYNHFDYNINYYPHNFPEMVANDFLKYKLEQIYQTNSLYKLTKSNEIINIPNRVKKWLYSYDINISKSDIDTEPHLHLYKLIKEPLKLLNYIKTVDENYNKRITQQLWSWKITEDERKKLVWFMKTLRKKYKFMTSVWLNIHSYLF